MVLRFLPQFRRIAWLDWLWHQCWLLERRVSLRKRLRVELLRVADTGLTGGIGNDPRPLDLDSQCEKHWGFLGNNSLPL